MKRRLPPLLLLIVSCVLSGCQSSRVQPVVGVFTASGAGSPLSGEQEKGYNRVMDSGAAALVTTRKAESALQDETQKSIRDMVESETQPVVAVIGATSNQATARTAALVNFFKVPMIIPTAAGDNLVPSNNLWAFRLSAPGSAYAGYFFGNVLNKTNILRQNLLPETLANFTIAILYEENTFGESAAVVSAETVLQQVIEINSAQSLYGMEIAVYGSFPADKIDNDRIYSLVSQVKEQGAQLVYLITDHTEIAAAVVETFNEVYDQNALPLPVLVGQAGAFATQSFAASPAAADVILLRQHWNRERCPENITSFYEAQSYGGAYLLDLAVRQVQDIPVASGWNLKKTDPLAALTTFRENLRNQVKNSRLDVPCFGQVSFDTTGQNRELSFEFVSRSKGAETLLAPDEFLNRLKTRILLDE